MSSKGLYIPWYECRDLPFPSPRILSGLHIHVLTFCKWRYSSTDSNTTEGEFYSELYSGKASRRNVVVSKPGSSVGAMDANDSCVFLSVKSQHYCEYTDLKQPTAVVSAVATCRENVLELMLAESF